jgi:hypothetical protein
MNRYFFETVVQAFPGIFKLIIAKILNYIFRRPHLHKYKNVPQTI